MNTMKMPKRGESQQAKIIENETAGLPSNKTNVVDLPFLEGFGDLNQILEQVTETHKSGNDDAFAPGERVVVLHHVVTGAKGESFVRGSVRPLSLFFNLWGQKEHKDILDAQIVRLFSKGAIRLASEEEKGHSYVNLDTDDYNNIDIERQKRIALEKELAKARELMRENKIGLGTEV